MPDRADRNWPLPFVVKTNNGSGGNIFVRDHVDHEELERKIAVFLSHDFGKFSDEEYYRNVEPQVLVEPFISNSSELPWDYKCHVFDGKLEFIQLDLDREFAHKRVLYDPNWEQLQFRFGTHGPATGIPRPRNFEKMIDIAETIGSSFGYVRVDLYNIEGQIFVGELGFTPDAGLSKFDPQSMDLELGKLWPWPDPAFPELL